MQEDTSRIIYRRVIVTYLSVRGLSIADYPVWRTHDRTPGRFGFNTGVYIFWVVKKIGVDVHEFLKVVYNLLILFEPVTSYELYEESPYNLRFAQFPYNPKRYCSPQKNCCLPEEKPYSARIIQLLLSWN